MYHHLFIHSLVVKRLGCSQFLPGMNKAVTCVCVCVCMYIYKSGEEMATHSGTCLENPMDRGASQAIDCGLHRVGHD